jgi:ATP-binding cassette, subfamily C, type I secretion system permease/ATPase
MARLLRCLAVLKSMAGGSEHTHASVGDAPCIAPPYTKLTDVLISCRDGLIAVGAFSMGINILVLTVSIYMLQVYDRVLPARSVETLIYLTIIATGALCAMGALELLRSRILVRLGIWIDRSLSPTLFGRGLENTLRGLPYRTEALRDLTTLRSYLGGAGIMALFDAPWLPIFLAFIFLLHPFLGLLALGGAAVLILLALTNNALTSEKLKRANIALTKGYQNAEAAFRNAEVIDGMGMAPALIRRWNTLNTDVLQLQQGASDTAGLINACTKSLRMFLQIAVLGLGAWLVLRQELSAGSMVAASIIMSRALAPVEQAIASWKQTTAARDAWKRLSTLFQLPPLHPPSMPLPRPRGYLTIENVIYAPAGARHPVLRDISLSLVPGEALAIIGPSAAGKSTLARLIVGLAQPQHGFIRLDGADVFAGSRENFGHYVGYLPQDVALFPGTVRENIARMDNSDPSHVVAAAMMAGVHDLILRLPNGYETEIGEQGTILSGGQRQRIGLARAVYGRPALLVLDEPNSNLDASGEEALNRAITAMKASGSTIVLVAHRPSLRAHIDQVLVLCEGQMQLVGPREPVLAQLRRPQYPTDRPRVRIVKG